MTRPLSPMGFYYRFANQRLTRKRHLEQPWSEFSVQAMTAEELRFVAGVIDEARESLE